MNASCLSIKKSLEAAFDIPFIVIFRNEFGDPQYIISPVNEMEELFEVRILFRQHIRMIIEIEPQRYAASMLDDIHKVDDNKRKLFLKYVNLFKEKNAKVEFFINQKLCDITDGQTWKDKWGKFRIRATKISEDEFDNEIDNSIIISEWAKLSVGMLLSLLHIETAEEKQRFSEGKVSQVLTNRYERNPINRELCLASNGYICKVCNFDFEEVYGELGKKFIHVHHIEKVSSFGGEYFLDPEIDMIPVCPNCHAMLHRVDPPMCPDELTKIILENSEKN